ncbi:MAG TPA: hypothetical protein VK043_04140, partial [Burkholderiales bacterium]|nr:hypothetical protein [Burkholderiales bacterium]
RLLPTIRSRCVAVPVPVPPPDVAAEWLAGQGLKDAPRWLAFASGAPLRALAYAEDPAALQRLIDAVTGGRRVLPDTREDLEALAEVLQKHALDQAMALMGLPSIYGLSTARGPNPELAEQWLRFAREMGPSRALARHPLNPRLFAADLQARAPESKK